jgi:hypothetical protein
MGSKAPRTYVDYILHKKAFNQTTSHSKLGQNISGSRARLFTSWKCYNAYGDLAPIMLDYCEIDLEK